MTNQIRRDTRMKYALHPNIKCYCPGSLNSSFFVDSIIYMIKLENERVLQLVKSSTRVIDHTRSHHSQLPYVYLL